MKIRRWIANFLLLAGLVGLGVWAWPNVSGPIFQSWGNWAFDREISGKTATISEYLAEKSGQIADRMRSWFGLSLPRRESAPPPVVPQSRRPRSIEDNGLIGRLTIPRLQLSAIVREGTGEDTLSLALGHIPSTALPGQAGNVGVAGHRDTLFRCLREIRKDDLILFETLDGSYAYEVKSTEIVNPQNVSVLNTSDQPELTLVTCYPFYYVGSAPDRFIVKARQVSEGALARKVSETLPEMASQVKEPAAERGDAHSASNGAGYKPGVRKVSFQVSNNHSGQLAPGISLGVTGTDALHRTVDGWIWLMPDRRTIWLRNQVAHEPVVFYGSQDGKKRELLITTVTNHAVTGSLFLPDSSSATGGIGPPSTLGGSK